MADPAAAPVSWKLFLGRNLAAWAALPDALQRLRAVPAGKPILVTGAHRTGTTWFGHMLAATGLWHVHEPTAPYRGCWDQWYSYAPGDRPPPRLERLISGILRGRDRRALAMPHADWPVLPLRWLPCPIKRVLIKDPIACLASESLHRHFDFEVLALFRHPGAFVESVTRLNWPSAPLIQQFLADERLMADWFADLRSLLESADGSDAVQDAALVHACISRILWGYVQRNPGMRPVQFEQAAADPMAYFDNLHRQLGLPRDERTIVRQQQLSAGRQRSKGHRPHDVRRDSSELVNGWRQRLAGAELGRVRAVWERFELPLYLDEAQWTAP